MRELVTTLRLMNGERVRIVADIGPIDEIVCWRALRLHTDEDITSRLQSGEKFFAIAAVHGALLDELRARRAS